MTTEFRNEALSRAANLAGDYIGVMLDSVMPGSTAPAPWHAFAFPTRAALAEWYAEIAGAPTLYFYLAAFDKTRPGWSEGEPVAEAHGERVATVGAAPSSGAKLAHLDRIVRDHESFWAKIAQERPTPEMRAFLRGYWDPWYTEWTIERPTAPTAAGPELEDFVHGASQSLSRLRELAAWNGIPTPDLGTSQHGVVLPPGEGFVQRGPLAGPPSVSGGGHHHGGGGHHHGGGGRRFFGGGGYDGWWGGPDYLIVEEPVYDYVEDEDGQTRLVRVGKNSLDMWAGMEGSPPGDDPPFSPGRFNFPRPPHAPHHAHAQQLDHAPALHPHHTHHAHHHHMPHLHHAPRPRGVYRWHRQGVLAEIAPVLAPATNGVTAKLVLDRRHVLHAQICVDGRCYRTAMNLRPVIDDIMHKLAEAHAQMHAELDLAKASAEASDSAAAKAEHVAGWWEDFVDSLGSTVGDAVDGVTDMVSGDVAADAVSDAVAAAGDGMVDALVSRHVAIVCAGWFDDLTGAVTGAVKSAVHGVTHAVSSAVGTVGHTLGKLKGPIAAAAGIAAGAAAAAIPAVGPIVAPMAGKLAGDLVNAAAGDGDAKKAVQAATQAATSDSTVAAALDAAHKAVAQTTVAYHIAETAKAAAKGDASAADQVQKLASAADQGDPAARAAMDLAHEAADALRGMPADLQAALSVSGADLIDAYRVAASRAVASARHAEAAPALGYLRSGRHQKVYLFGSLQDAENWYTALDPGYSYAAFFDERNLATPVVDDVGDAGASVSGETDWWQRALETAGPARHKVLDTGHAIRVPVTNAGDRTDRFVAWHPTHEQIRMFGRRRPVSYDEAAGQFFYADAQNGYVSYDPTWDVQYVDVTVSGIFDDIANAVTSVPGALEHAAASVPGAFANVISPQHHQHPHHHRRGHYAPPAPTAMIPWTTPWGTHEGT